MRVGGRRRARQTGLLAVALLLGGRDSAAQDNGDNSASLDIYALSQLDDGGNPYRTESFEYVGFRPAASFRLSDVLGLRMSTTVALLLNDDQAPLPPTVQGATTTSASPTLVTLDAVATVDITPRHSDWTVSPGATYHHQFNYFVHGLDMAVSRSLAGGDTVLSAAFNFRWARSNQRYWSGERRGRSYLFSDNLLLGWTQTVSPTVLTSVSLQYTRQDGLLLDPLSYVVLFDDAGVPVAQTDERLPDTRNRFQVNGRVRYALRLGSAVGLDGSLYIDDWGVWLGAAQPSLELTLSSDIRWRLWYRFSVQKDTRYFRGAPRQAQDLQTQDSDLSNFTMHSPGTIVIVPVGQAGWATRIALYGYFRDDGLLGFGASAGATVSW